MSVLGWILAAILAVAYLGAGGLKLSQSREKIGANPNMAWVGDVTDQQLKLIGGVEVLGALGVLLPWLTDIAAVLTPIAAIGLALVQVFAARLHLRRGEKQSLVVNAVLFVLAVVVAVIRFSQL